MIFFFISGEFKLFSLLLWFEFNPKLHKKYFFYSRWKQQIDKVNHWRCFFVFASQDEKVYAKVGLVSSLFTHIHIYDFFQFQPVSTYTLFLVSLAPTTLKCKIWNHVMIESSRIKIKFSVPTHKFYFIFLQLMLF